MLADRGLALRAILGPGDGRDQGFGPQPSQREPSAASTLTVRAPTDGSAGADEAAMAWPQAARARGSRKRVSWPNPCLSSRPRRWWGRWTIGHSRPLAAWMVEMVR